MKSTHLGKIPSQFCLYFSMFAFAILLAACGNDGGGAARETTADGAPSVLTNSVAVEAGADCAYGGIQVETGIDLNLDGILDADEITETQYVCNGADGFNILVLVSAEPAGINCSNGGQKVETGLDDNGDGILDAAEVDDTDYICDGTDGFNSLVLVSVEAPGSNCPLGGMKIESGLDLDRDGVLAAGEVDPTATRYVCNTGDLIPPTVLSTHPVDASTTFFPDGSLKVTFSEAMDDATIDASTFTLTGGAPTGSVSYSNGVATYTPGGLLAFNTPYTASVSATVRDLAGNALGNDYTWSFTTAADNGTAPVVASTTPAAGAVGVGLSTPIKATFSEPMIAATINTTNFLLVDGIGNSIIGSVTYNGGTATFLPPGPLAHSTTYTATIKGGAGGVQDLPGNNMAADHNWSFTTATKSWVYQGVIENQTGFDATRPQAATDGYGNVYLLWFQKNLTNSNLYGKRYDAATGWDAASEGPHQPDTGALQSFSLTANATGQMFTAWSQLDGPGGTAGLYNVYSRRYASGAWEATTLLENEAANSIYYPHIAMNDSGVAFMVSSVSGVIFFPTNRYWPGSGWHSGTRLTSGGTYTNTYYAKVAVNPSGVALTAYNYSFYTGCCGANFSMRTALSSGTGWTSVDTIRDGLGAYSSQYDNDINIGMDGTGDAQIVWMQTSDIHASYAQNSVWTINVLLEDSAKPATIPKLAVSANGTALAVWSQSDGTAESIFANRFDGTVWQTLPATQIDNLDTIITEPRVGIDSNGNGYAAWVQFDGVYNSIYVARYDPAMGWGTPLMLDDPALGIAKNPWVTMNGSGDAFVIWSQEPGDGSLEYSLYASRLE